MYLVENSLKNQLATTSITYMAYKYPAYNKKSLYLYTKAISYQQKKDLAD